MNDKTARKTRSTLPATQPEAGPPPQRVQPAGPPVQHTSLLEAISKAAADPNVDIEKMERLFAMHEKLQKSQAEAAFNAAMARAQAKIQPIIRDRMNDHTRSMYATLAAINEEIVPIYTAEGLSVSFDTQSRGDEKEPIPDGYVRILAYVSHEAGHTRKYHLDLPPDTAGAKGNINKTGVQAMGSTNSYGRRYIVMMIFNISTADDVDGNDDEGRLDEQQYADFETAVDAIVDKEGADKLWPKIAAACEKVGDRENYAKLHKRLADRLKATKAAA